MSTDQERDIQIARGVYAIGVCILPPKLRPVMTTALEAMKGDDWVPVPMSLARAMHDTMSIHIRKRLAYLGANKLIEMDMEKGELRLTQLGAMALKKLEANVTKN